MKAHLALAGALLVACNGNEDGNGPDDTDPSASHPLAGLYAVTYDAASPECGEYVENPIPIPYLNVVAVDGVLEARICRSPEDCDDFADLDFRFADDGGAYVTIRTWTYYNENSGGICAHQARRTKLVADDGRITLESVEVSEVQAAGDATDNDGCQVLLDAWSPTFSQDPYDCWKIVAERGGN